MLDWTVPERPREVLFSDSITRVLGHACGFQPRVSVSRDRLLDEVLIDAGINPFDPPWPLYGTSFVGLYQIVSRAFERASETGLYFTSSQGLWGLTVLGVEKAVELHANSDDLLPQLPDSFGSGDKRDASTWVILELSKRGMDQVEEGALERDIRRDLDLDQEHQVFVPAVRYCRANRSYTVHLMEGYVFIASGLPEAEYFKLERRVYAKQVMSQVSPSGMRSLSVIDNEAVERMRIQLRQELSSNVRVGDEVEITEGTYKDLEGTVLDVEVDGSGVEVADILVALRSIQMVLRLPRVFLQTVDN